MEYLVLKWVHILSSTTVDGLYVAGDVAVDLNQISVATGHAAIASTTIHNRL